MSVDVVEGPRFTQGETDTDRDYAIQRDRAAFDLTGYSNPKLYVRNKDTGEALTAITGSIPSPATGGIVRFSHDTITAEDADEWRAQVELVHPTLGTRRLPKWIRIPVGPKVED